MRGNFLPDKEFRYLRHCCYSLVDTSITSTNLDEGGPDHFCLVPHVAMRVGLYLHRRNGRKSLVDYRRASRAVSEDPSLSEVSC